MDKENSGPNESDYELIYDHFKDTKELNIPSELQDNPHINKIDSIYMYKYENLNSSPQERIKNLDNGEPQKDFNHVNSQQPETSSKKKKSNFIKYFLTGLICSIVSIFLSVIIMLYIIPKSEIYKDSSLSKELDNKINAKVSEAIGASNPSQTTINKIEPTTDKSLTITEIASSVSPAVVGISKGTIQDSYLVQGFGSGVIFREDGYILTNYHVVEDAVNNVVQIVFYDDSTVQARIVNFNENLDIAVVKVDGIEMPGVATLGNSSDLKTGELAVAFGSPLGRQYLGSVSAGIISSPSRLISVNTNATVNAIQTDAAINPGNSGGPLVDGNGEVIGINSAKISLINGEKVEGMGFAIPIDQIKPLLDQDTANNLLVDNPNITSMNIAEKYTGPLLGINVESIFGDKAKENNYPEGLLVHNITGVGTPADRAGIEPGDIIISIDEKPVRNVSDIREIIKDCKQGDKVTLQVQKNLNVPPKNIIVTF